MDASESRPREIELFRFDRAPATATPVASVPTIADTSTTLPASSIVNLLSTTWTGPSATTAEDNGGPFGLHPASAISPLPLVHVWTYSVPVQPRYFAAATKEPPPPPPNPGMTSTNPAMHATRGVGRVPCERWCPRRMRSYQGWARECLVCLLAQAGRHGVGIAG